MNTSQQTQDMRDILGAVYKPRYERLLHFIPFEQFRDVEPFGRGKFGDVHSATWRRSSSMEHKEAKDIPVVLKRVLPTLRMSDRKKLEKFLCEVRGIQPSSG